MWGRDIGKAEAEEGGTKQAGNLSLDSNNLSKWPVS